MKLVYFSALAVAGGLSFYWWFAQRTPVASLHPAAPRTAARVSTALRLGTVVVSHSYPLLSPTSDYIKRTYVELGQPVHKGTLLLKFANYTFLVAPVNGIVTRQLVETSAYAAKTAPVVSFTELSTFQLRLPGAATRQPLQVGQLLQMQNATRSAELATGGIFSRSVSGTWQVLNLRLRTLGAGTQVQVNLL